MASQLTTFVLDTTQCRLAFGLNDDKSVTEITQIGWVCLRQPVKTTESQ